MERVSLRTEYGLSDSQSPPSPHSGLVGLERNGAMLTADSFGNGRVANEYALLHPLVVRLISS